MAVANPIPRLTEAEYLEIERAAEHKSEFFDGEMFAMSGGSPMHSLISVNLATALNLGLKGGSCRPFNSDLRIKVEETGLFAYPDVSVVCGPLQTMEGATDVLVNPTLIVEVLSDSTEACDRGKKFENYRKISSLREYLLVSQKWPVLERFTKQEDGDWLLHEVSGMESSVELNSLDVTLALSDIYANVEFGRQV
jgi:Uma2 family endonuclease